jgi:hypothetical protein
LPEFDFDLLVEQIKNGKVVPVIGTELYSDGAGAALESAIARELALKLKLDNVPSGATPRDLALAYLVNRGDMATLADAVSDVTQRVIVEPPRAVEQLAEITDFRLFVTTAIDRMLEKALVRARSVEPISVAYSPTNHALELPDMQKALVPAVAHILGRVDGDFPLGDAELLEYLQSLLGEARRPKRLFDELNGRNLLFIGCGFPDWLLRLFIRTVKDKEYQASFVERRAQFIADARTATDPNLTLFLTHYNLRVHPSGSPTEFVDKLHEIWTRSARPRPPALQAPAAVIEQGAVFLSFSSLDRIEVKAIAARLREAGITVWFDETNLEIGDDWNRMIKENLVRATLFVAFVSKNTESLVEQPRYFWSEWNLANERATNFAPGTKYIIPVALDPEVGPDSARVPDAFRRAQWAALPGRTATQEFVDQIQREYRRKQPRPD